jgi:tellurite resistance protein
MITHHQALVYTMVIMSAADQNMRDIELGRIDQLASSLPCFHGYDIESLPNDTKACAAFFQDDDGLDKVLALIAQNTPPQLKETAYALACEIAAVDGIAVDEEIRLLQMLRQELELDRLIATGIERGARARHATF